MEESKLLPSVCHTQQSTSFLVLPEAFWSSRCVRARCCCGREWLCIWCLTDQSSSLKKCISFNCHDWLIHMSECNNNALIAFHICGEYLFNVCAFKRFSDFFSFNFVETMNLFFRFLFNVLLHQCWLNVLFLENLWTVVLVPVLTASSS